MPALDLTGQRFGLLIAVERAPNQNGRTMWCCECDCGGEKVVRADALRGARTKSCGCISGPLTKEEWISRAKQKHGNKYDYSKVDYQGAHKKVVIICRIHEPFPQAAGKHLAGDGCPECGDERAAAAKRKSTAEWIRDFRKVHGDRYEYSDFQIKHSGEKIKIICPEHGPFPQTAYSHQSGSGCPDCGNETVSRKARETRGMTQDEWIVKAIEVHGDFYDYSKVDYQGTDEYVTIICPLHGEQPQIAKSHEKGMVPLCCAGRNISKGKRWRQEKWIAKAKEVHGDFYDYSLVDYQGSWVEVQIICPIHGEFPQKAAVHSTMERGCPKCGRIKQAASQTYTQEEFLRLAGEAHGDRYDYSETEYKPRKGGEQEEMIIICRKHGPFLQKAQVHLRGAGCQVCKEELIKRILTKSQDRFIADARKIHGDRYDYSEVEYKGAKE